MEVCWIFSLRSIDRRELSAIDWSHFLSSKSNFMAILPILGYVVFGLANVAFFSMALKGIQPSIAFGVWMGMALLGTAIVDITIFHQPFGWQKVLFIALILAGIIGLKSNSAY